MYQDTILAHQMSRLLDRPTREAWETSRVNLTELPTFEEFETFLTARVRALEIASDMMLSPKLKRRIVSLKAARLI